MKRLLVVFAVAVVCLFPWHRVVAQEASAPPAELKKIGYLVGTWNVVATAYSTDGSAPKKSTLTFKNEWVMGHYFLSMRSTYTDGTTGIAYMGYDKDAGVYTFDEYESTGYTDHSTGKFEGDTWKWTSGKNGSPENRDRFTMKLVSPTEYSFKYESLMGAEWKVTMDGVGKKAK